MALDGDAVSPVDPGEGAARGAPLGRPRPSRTLLQNTATIVDAAVAAAG